MVYVPGNAYQNVPSDFPLFTDSGIVLTAGQQFTITAQGSMRWDYTYHPDSYVGPAGDDTLYPFDQGARVWKYKPFCQLIARFGTSLGIGNRSNYLQVGAGGTFKAPDSLPTGGTLFLLVNDSYWPDNDGGFQVNVMVNEAPPGSCGAAYAGIDAKAAGDPISLYLGEKRFETTDISLTTPDGSLSFTRTYRQSKLTDSNYQFLGAGWTHNHNQFVMLNAPTLTLYDTNGSKLLFMTSDNITYAPTAGSVAVFTGDGTTHPSLLTMTTSDKTQYIFEVDSVPTGTASKYRLKQVLQTNNEVLNYLYDTASGSANPPGKLIQVNDGYFDVSHNALRQLVFTYDTFNRLQYVGDQTFNAAKLTGRYVQFSYTLDSLSNSLLTGVRDVLGNTWTYRYNLTDPTQADFLLERQSPLVDVIGNGTLSHAISLEKNTYLTNGSAMTSITQALGDGATTTTWVFQPNGQNITTETIAGKQTIHHFQKGYYAGAQDPLGNFSSQTLDFQFRPNSQTNALGHQTQLTWSPDGAHLNQVVDALGNPTAFTYNHGGGSDGTLSTSVDAQGHTTHYTYDSHFPQLPSRIQVYDTNGITILRWQEFTYDVTNNKGRVLAEKTFDPSGTILQQEVDRTYYASGSSTGLLQTVVQKDLVNPANNVATTYFYDNMGRSNRTNQSATFGSCTSSFTLYDVAGNVLASVCNYDAGSNTDPTTLAQLLAFYNPTRPDTNRITTYAYDALNRRIQTTTDTGTPYAQTSLTVYDSLNRVIRTIANYISNPAVPDPYVHSRTDFTHGVNNDQNLLTDTAYNERGLLKSQTDVLGNVVLYGYDDAGRLIKTVQSASQPTYDNSYSPNSDPSLNQYVPSSSPDLDLISLNQYDAAGNLIQTTDTLGNITLTGYDALSRPVRTIRNASNPTYNIAVDPTLSNYPVSTAPDQDLTSYTEYNALGQVQRTQDTLGNWTLNGYDGLGRSVQTIRNASNPTYNILADPSLSNYPVSTAPDQDLLSTTAYDTVGRVMYSADVLGRRTWSAYDGLNRVIKTVSNASGTATDGSAKDPRSPTYNPITNLADTDLISSTLYDSNGYVQWTQDVLGHKTWPAYDSIGRQIRTIANAVGTATDGTPNDPRSPTYIASSVPDQDVTTQTVYNAQGRVAANLDALGNQTQYTYDALGRRIQTIANFVTGTFHLTAPDQDLVSLTTYDLAGRVIATLDPRGTQTTYTYDRVGRRLMVTQAAGTSQAVTSYTCYDKGGRVLRTIQNWITTPSQPSPDARDGLGNWLFNPTLHGGANDQNLISTYTLDQAGRQLAASDPFGNASQMVYYRDGQPESTVDPLGIITKYRYDLARRRVLAVTSYTATSLTDPATWTWNAAASQWQDGKGVPIPHNGATNDQNIIVQTTYDKAGRMLALRDPRGNRTTYSYDLLNRRTSLVDPLAHQWNTTYLNSNNRLQTTLTDPLGQVTQQTADALGRVKAIQYFNESPKLTPDVSILYDKGGNRLRMTEQAANATPVRATTFGYDQARRLNQVTFDVNGDGTTLQTVGYHYDPGGLRTQLTLPGNLSVNYTYDPRGQLTSLTDWSSQQTTYAYDKVGRPTMVNRSNGLLSQYGYDSAGRLQRLRHSTGTRLLGQFDYTIDARGNRTQVTETVAQNTPSTTLAYNDPSIAYYLGSWSAAAPFMVSTDVSAALRIPFSNDQITLTMGTGPDHSLYDVYLDGDLWSTQDGYATTTGTQVVTIALSGYGSHRLEVRNRPDKSLLSSGYKVRFQSLQLAGQRYDWQTLRYSYDNLARLIQAATYAGGSTGGTSVRQYNYQFDVAGNRAQQVVTVNGTPTTTNYTYDAANRLTSDGTHTYTYDTAGRLTNDGVNTYTWDRANRLLTYNGTANQYAYDGDGHRIKQTVAGLVTQYVIDVQPGLAKVISTTTSGNTTRYLHAPMGIHQQQNADTTWRWMIQDGLGSLRGEVDNSVNQQESRQYSPYGEVTETSGSSQSVFGFTGEETDSNGLVNLRARYYNPLIGQFMVLDPFEGNMNSPLALNRYNYVQGNVTNIVDPTGMCACPFGYMPLGKYADCTQDCVPITEYLGGIYTESFNQSSCAVNQLSTAKSNAKNAVASRLLGIPGMGNFQFQEPANDEFNLDLGATSKYADCLLKDRSITDLERMARLSDFVASAYPSDKSSYLRLTTRVILGVEPSGFAAAQAAASDHCQGWGRDSHDCPKNSSPNQQLRDTGFNTDYQDGHNQIFHYWASVASIGGTGSLPGWIAKVTVNTIGLQIIHELLQGCICNIRAGTGIALPFGDAGGSWEDFKLTMAGIYFGTHLALGDIQPSEMGNKMRDILGPNPSVVFGVQTANQLNYYFPLPRYRVSCGQNSG